MNESIDMIIERMDIRPCPKPEIFGNKDHVVIGIFEEANDTWTAKTPKGNKSFKALSSAKKWMKQECPKSLYFIHYKVGSKSPAKGIDIPLLKTMWLK